MVETKSILEMAQGAIMEQVNLEVSKIVDNILDLNTEPKKKRTLTLTVDFVPNSDRSQVVINATAKSKLLPNNAVQTTLYVGADASTGEIQAVEMGDGPIDAALLALEQIVGCHYELDDFQIQAVTEGREAMGEALIKLRFDGVLYSGRGISTDIMGASIKAYLNALNKIVYEED